MKYPKTLAAAFFAVAAAITPPLYQIGADKVVFNAAADDKARHACLQSEAIVVFTGGTGRVETGKTLHENVRTHNPDAKLFISADAREIHLASLTNDYQFIIDDRAENTIDNARITADWAYENDINNVCLVTDDYHMSRSVFELKSVAPDLEITRYPVHNNDAGQNERKKLGCRIYEDFAISVLGLKAKAGEYCYPLRNALAGLGPNLS
jgi:uncharacterized SAM-binding protein YcdF (DUF218 family)